MSRSPPTSYTIAGSVTSSSSTCKDGVAVAFADKTNGRMIGTTTAVDGSFSVSLPNGSYRFSSGKPGCIDAEAPATVTVAGAAQTGLSRTLTAADATITGRVTLSGTGITIPTKVMAQTSDGRFVFTDVDTSASGGADNYSLDVPAGTTWSITARSDGYSAAAVTAVAGASDADLTLTAISGYTRKEPQSTSITPNVGGEFTDPNIGSTFKLNIPAGALGSSTTSNTVTTAPTTAIVTETPTVLIVGTSGIKITATDGNGNEVSTLNDDAEITIPYTDADVTAAGVSETQLQVYVWNGVDRAIRCASIHGQHGYQYHYRGLPALLYIRSRFGQRQLCILRQQRHQRWWNEWRWRGAAEAEVDGAALPAGGAMRLPTPAA